METAIESNGPAKADRDRCRYYPAEIGATGQPFGGWRGKRHAGFEKAGGTLRPLKVQKMPCSRIKTRLTGILYVIHITVTSFNICVAPLVVQLRYRCINRYLGESSHILR